MPIETEFIDLDPNTEIEVRVTISGPVANVTEFKRRLKALRQDRERLLILDRIAPACCWSSTITKAEDGTIIKAELCAYRPPEGSDRDLGIRNFCDLLIETQEEEP